MTIWLIARGAGLAALVLLTLATALGALVSGAGPARPGARVVAQYAHRVTASLGLAVLGLHLTMILADSLAHVGWVGALVPFTAQYRPLWVGLGTLAAYTFLLVGATGFGRGRMAGWSRGAAAWRALHGAAYAGWALAMLHGLRAGTDSGVAWVRVLYLTCLVAVLGSVATRAVAKAPKPRVAARVGVQR
jgi:sulfoxide reductase heme-binding subunit YedZ